MSLLGMHIVQRASEWMTSSSGSSRVLIIPEPHSVQQAQLWPVRRKGVTRGRPFHALGSSLWSGGQSSTCSPSINSHMVLPPPLGLFLSGLMEITENEFSGDIAKVSAYQIDSCEIFKTNWNSQSRGDGLSVRKALIVPSRFPLRVPHIEQGTCMPGRKLLLVFQSDGEVWEEREKKNETI